MNPSPHKSDLRSSNRVIAIGILLTIVCCSIPSWYRLYELAVVQIKMLSASPHDQETQSQLRSEWSRLAIRPYAGENYETVSHKDDTVAPAFSIPLFTPLATRVHEKIKDYVTFSTSAANEVKYSFVKLNTFAHQILGVLGIHGKHGFTFRMSDGSVSTLKEPELRYDKPIPSKQYIDHITELHAYAQSYGADLLVTCPIIKTSPAVIVKSWQQPLLNMNLETHKIMKSISAKGIPVLDFISIAQQRDANYSHFLYRTDHHWTSQAGFWAFQQIAADYQRRKAVEIPAELLDKNNYREICYPNAFLGSIGKRVGTHWAKPDDFSFIIPKFPTHFEHYLPSDKLRQSGDFDCALLNSRPINPGSVYLSNHYGCLLLGDHETARIMNLSHPPIPKKLLVVQDSFGRAVTPYLALLFRELDIVDPRYKKESVLEYVKRTKPDYILYIILPLTIGETWYD